MATEFRETEHTYEAPPGTPLPSFDGLPGVAALSEPVEQTLAAEYFDTADLRLIASGITLRRRRGGTDAGWHLKLPAGPATRTEVRLPLGRSGRRVPGELAALVRVYARGRPLAPVALITTTRQLRVLADAEGSSLAEVASDDVSAQTMGEAAVISRWHELEVELTGGDPELLAAADDVLRRSGWQLAVQQKKLERALDGQLPARPEPVLPPGREAGTTAEQAVLAYAGAQVAALTTLDPQVRRDVPDAVHQMRVAVRRLRGTLRVFRMVLSGPDTQALRAELKWLGTVLGGARDAEVLAARLEASVGRLPAELILGPVAARLRIVRAPAEAQARAALLKALDSPRYFALLDQLDQLLAEPPLGPAAMKPAAGVLAAAVGRARRRVRRRLHRAWHAPDGPRRDALLHEARKAAKDTRYAAEAAAPVLGRKSARLARQMKKLQTVLGDQHDTVVARETVRDLGVQAHLAGENAFSLGLLYGQEACLARELEQRARRAARKERRSWHRDRRGWRAAG
ncbi:MAG: CHAD domain-containing protein [Streptosporangiaceae bacterium]